MSALSTGRPRRRTGLGALVYHGEASRNGEINLTGCGGSDDDVDVVTAESPATTDDIVRAAEADDGATTEDCQVGNYGAFRTAMSSCEAAIEQGHSLAIATGAGTAGFEDGLDVVLVTTCTSLQGDTKVTADPISIEFARLVNVVVCPGDLSNIIAK